MSHSDIENETKLHQAYSEASFLLLENLILTLVDRRVMTREAAIEMVEAVVETKRNMVDDGVHPDVSRTATRLLADMANSIAALEGDERS